MRFFEGNIKLTEAVDVGPGDLSRSLEIDTIERRTIQVDNSQIVILH